MVVTFAGMIMEVKLDAFWNAPFPMLVNLEPASNVTLVNFDSTPVSYTRLNAYSPRLVTFAGMLIELKLNVPKNAWSPMLVTLAGMIMEVKLIAPSNALAPMLVTVAGISKFTASNDGG